MDEEKKNPQTADETAADRFTRLAFNAIPDTDDPVPENPAGTPPNERRCQGIAKGGGRCVAWAVKGGTLCAGHAMIGTEKAQQASRDKAAAAREARRGVRDRVAQALEDDLEAVLGALKAGVRLGDKAKAAKAAGDWIALVYGRQLQKPGDEAARPDPLDVAAMSPAERVRLKATLVAEHPELAASLGLASEGT